MKNACLVFVLLFFSYTARPQGQQVSVVQNNAGMKLAVDGKEQDEY
jgi:hypothetical protein